MTFQEILNISFWNNTGKEYLIALGVFILVLIILKLFKTFGIKKIKKVVDHVRIELGRFLAEDIESIGWPFYFLLSLYIAIQFLTLPAIVVKVIYYALVIAITYYAIQFVQQLIDYGAKKIISKKQREEGEEFEPSIIKIVGKIAKVALWIVAILLILQNLGYNVSALLAGVGIGGIAIAFALQNVLEDVFASFSIYFDKPFQIGDFIIIGNDMGTVEKIGINSTRIRTLQGQELTVSNKELTSTRINNYGRMERRRIVFGFGVEYDTPAEKLRRIPEMVKNIISEIEATELDRVHFKEYGDFSLNFEVVYYVNSPDYNEYMDIQQDINLKINEKFEEENIVFAYPTQTINLQTISKGE